MLLAPIEWKADFRKEPDEKDNKKQFGVVVEVAGFMRIGILPAGGQGAGR